MIEPRAGRNQLAVTVSAGRRKGLWLRWDLYGKDKR
jgi:hypothetical protein